MLWVPIKVASQGAIGKIFLLSTALYGTCEDKILEYGDVHVMISNFTAAKLTLH